MYLNPERDHEEDEPPVPGEWALVAASLVIVFGTILTCFTHLV